MTIIKAILVVLVVLASSVLIGQTDVSSHRNEPSRNIKKHDKLIKLKQVYFEETNLLKSYFLKNEIKNGFPGYNYSLTKDQNIIEIEKWLVIKENKNSLTTEGLNAIESYIKK